MLKEFFEAVLARVAPTQFRALDGEDIDRHFYDRPVHQPPQPRATPTATTRTVHSLAAIAEYLDENRDELDLAAHILHVSAPGKVELLGPLRPYFRTREQALQAVYLVDGAAGLQSWTDLDHGRIVLMAQFAPSESRSELLTALSRVVKEKLEVREDNDGVSQTLTIKEGVQALSLKRIENPVMLAPFATFPEVQQVVRPFVFRMDGSARFCLIPADGEAWKVEAVTRLKEYLTELLAEAEVSVPVIG